VAAYGDCMYLSGFTTAGASLTGMRVLDVSDPAHPTSVRFVPLTALPYHLRMLNGQLVASCSSSISLWSLTNPRDPLLLDTKAASGRVCALDGNNIVTGARVFRVEGDALLTVTSFTPGGSQRAGYPYGSAVGSGHVFSAPSARALILKAVTPGGPLPLRACLPIVRKP